MESLTVYYTLLVALDMRPYIANLMNCQILYGICDDEYTNGSHEFDIEETFMKMFSDIKKNRPKTNKMKNELLKLIKANSKRNRYEVNKTLVDLLQVDTEFKETILGKEKKIDLR